MRPHSWDLPLFLHVLGAMTLVGAVFTVLVLSLAGARLPGQAVLARASFSALLFVAIPAWVVTAICANWIASKEGLTGKHVHDPGWLTIGFFVLFPGVLILLVLVGLAFWWRRSGAARASRILAGLSAVYLLLLALAWSAMSGKWS